NLRHLPKATQTDKAKSRSAHSTLRRFPFPHPTSRLQAHPLTMPDHTSTGGAEEAVLKHKRIMEKYKLVRLSLAMLAVKTRALGQEPGVSPAVLIGFQKALVDVKKAHDAMLNGLCTEMMEELIPFAVEAMGDLVPVAVEEVKDLVTEVLAADKETAEYCADHDKTV
ncbi:hypothetical protein CONLIGDRAFT_390173, partial [Coniochaeta ligniaria NRRL 30616]